MAGPHIAYQARKPMPHPIPMYIRGELVGVLYSETLKDLLPFIPERKGDGAVWRRRVIAAAHSEADRVSSGAAKCYFIGGDEGAIKIGFSVDVSTRLKAIQSHSPIPVRVLALAPGGALRESAYHLQFAEHRLHGEWFARVPEIEAEIARLASPHPDHSERSV